MACSCANRCPALRPCRPVRIGVLFPPESSQKTGIGKRSISSSRAASLSFVPCCSFHRFVSIMLCIRSLAKGVLLSPRFPRLVGYDAILSFCFCPRNCSISLKTDRFPFGCTGFTSSIFGCAELYRAPRGLHQVAALRQAWHGLRDQPPVQALRVLPRCEFE